MEVEDRVVRWIVFAAVGAVFGVLVADELLLKDGRRLRGKVEKDGNAYIVRTRFGWVRVKADKVVDVIKGEATHRRGAEKASDSLLFEGSFEESYRRGVLFMREGKLEKGRFELLRALGMRPHDVRVWLKLGFTPTKDGWRYEARKVVKEQKRYEEVAKKVPVGEGAKARELVEKGLARLERRLRSRQKEVIPALPEQGEESGGWRWERTPYGWAWMPSNDWGWRVWQPFGWPLYRGNRCNITIYRNRLRNLTGRVWVGQRRIRLVEDP